MIRPGDSPEVYQLANSLGIESTDPAVGIVVHCRRLVDSWVTQAGGLGPGGIADIAAFETLITKKLSMVVEEIRSEDDFDRLTDHYARQKGDYVFAGLRARFDDLENPAFGVLIQRNKATTDAPDQYVAVIDARTEFSDEKFARRYFTKWHEIAHRMTTHCFPADPIFRSDEDPIETLMDAIASELAFYEPFLEPALQEVLANANWLTFEMIESIIERVFPEASFQATLFASMRVLPTPMVYLEIADDPLAIQKILPNLPAYAHWDRSGQPTNDDHANDHQNATDPRMPEQRMPEQRMPEQRMPEQRMPEQRMTDRSPNASTRIRYGQRVPRDSVFYRVAQGELLADEVEHHLCDFFDPEPGYFLGRFPSELTARKYSQQLELGHRGVLTHVQARRVPGKVFALLQY
jgi:hypothetical protein